MTHSPLAIDPAVIGPSQVSPWLIKLIYPLGTKFLHWYFGPIAIHGQENLPTSGPIILAPTHRSRWDAILLSLAAGRNVTGRDLRFMVAVTEVQGLQGWFIRHLGGFPIDVKRPEISSLSYSVQLLQAGEMLVIFPEGGIFRDQHTVHPLKRGVGRIAMEVCKQNPDTDIKVIPVTIAYSDPYPGKGTAVEINFGQGIAAKDYDPSTIKASSQKLTRCLAHRMQNLYGSENASLCQAIAAS
ncbi:1-acyl-sn-glycerol-3-phosphate acyltransferase [Synechocystis sp. FACHB-383]|uniref:lysophospholipid acyltransferase family protein n=1 Tax=Synechocystis sp. FACHB-383 TaxID=2692864 RepID=UPI00168304DC|nr:1-acyl-sn-glycerol-3-phosphate acyltransferase [Synechocystis sp. FACHB-383]MBD2653544.1 1-acyl-sn-glycerol-3-phosphate acyltransferase [Synechocystis sp. FACHB-383]